MAQRRLRVSDAAYLDGLRQRFDSRWVADSQTGCWNWTACIGNRGYGSIATREHNAAGTHRVAWLLYRGGIPEGMCVLHKCDNRQCVNPLHLFLGTKADNNVDRDIKGRAMRGENHVWAKLTEEKVREMRKRHAEGVGYKRLAKEYGVAVRAAYDAIKRNTWKHV